MELSQHLLLPLNFLKKLNKKLITLSAIPDIWLLVRSELASDGREATREPVEIIPSDLCTAILLCSSEPQMLPDLVFAIDNVERHTTE